MFALRRGGGREWWRGSVLSGVIPMVSLLLIGYPLSGAAVRTTLLGWALIAIGATQSTLGHHPKTLGSPAAFKAAPARWMSKPR